MSKPLSNPGILAELLSEAGAGKKGNSKSFILDCPRCKKKDKLYIRKTDGRFVCWYCKEIDNFQGAPEFVFSELLGRPLGELRVLIYGLDGPRGSLFLDLDLKDFFGDDDEVDMAAEALPSVVADPGWRELNTQWGEPGAKYLESRGISTDLAMEYGIQFWPAQKRVVFPVVNGGRLLGWQSRYVGPTEFFDEETGRTVKIPKALTYEGLKKDRTLMFGDRIDGDHAVLTEGPIDAIKAHLCGGNVCSMGKAVSRFQLSLLRTSGIKRLYLGLDPDAAPEIKRVVDELHRDVELYDMRAPAPYEDLGQMSMGEVLELFHSAPKVNRGTFFLYLKDHYGRS
jgi:hypothetical protein